MKVLLRRNVRNLGQIGEVVEVKAGYARNYLLPQLLAVAPTAGNLKAIEAEKKAYLEELARQRAELQTQANLLQGREFTIVARANEEGHLYGSIGPAQIAQAMDKDGVRIAVENIRLPEPIRKVDKVEVTVEFAEEVNCKVFVLVTVPPEDLAAIEAAKAEKEHQEREKQQRAEADEKFEETE